MSDKKQDPMLMHRLDLLKKYFPVDEKNKTVDIKLYYNRASELLDFSVGESKREMVSDDVIDKIVSFTDLVPKEYQANILLEIQDYEGYSPKLLSEKFNDLIELNAFDYAKERRQKKFISSILIIIGFILLLFLQFAKRYRWFGEEYEIKRLIFEEMIDISSWVFIWEAVSLLFLSPAENKNNSFNLVLKIKSIIFCDKESKIIYEDTQRSLEERLDFDTRTTILNKNLLLISSTTILCLTAYSLSTTLEDIYFYNLVYNDVNKEFPLGQFITETTLLAFYHFVLLMAGISGIEKYFNKGHFKNFTKHISIVIAFFSIAIIVLSIITKKYNIMISSIFALIFSILFIISVVGNERHNKQLLMKVKEYRKKQKTKKDSKKNKGR
jgi:hypothetical protein